MKKIILTLSLTLLPIISHTDSKPDISGIITLMGYNNFAHACPVNDGNVYTAGHVVRADKDSNYPVFFTWSDGRGGEGIAEPLMINNYRYTLVTFCKLF